MEIKIAIPLEIKRKKDLKKWIQIGYKCIVLINKNSEEIKGKIISQAEKLLQISEKAYAIIWFFDDGMSQQHYAQLLNNATLILRRNDCLIYEITQISQSLPCQHIGAKQIVWILFSLNLLVNTGFFVKECFIKTIICTEKISLPEY